MEIKTLEQYILNELADRTDELETACAQLANLAVDYKKLSEQYERLKGILCDCVENKGNYYSMYVWKNDEHYKSFDKLFQEFSKEQKIEDESESGEEV